MTKGKLLSAIVLAGSLLATSAPAQADKYGVWTGVDLAPSSYYVYLGAVAALTGQDITTQGGFLLRASGGYGQYDYNTPSVVGGVDGTVTSGDIMLGYAYFVKNASLKAYLGADVNHHNDDPNDPTSDVEGTEGGVKGLLELQANVAPNIDLGAMGSYSTSFDTYWTRFTGSYNFGAFKVGPEVLFLGDEGYNQQRVGLTVSDIGVGPANVRLYAGYASTQGRGDDGAYGGVAVGAGF